MRQKLLGSAFALALALTANARQESLPEVVVDSGSGNPIRLTRFVHDEAAIDVDGHLDEPAWSNLPAIRELRVLEPDTLAEPRYATEVRILYTELGLYIGVDMEQPADTLVRRFTPRDDFDVNRDYVSVTLDTSGSGRYGYWMNVSLGDSQRDGTILPERLYSAEWDGAWYGATQVTARGWSAEMFVPWSQMAMTRERDQRRIGFYMQRQVAHRNEIWGWPALPSSQSRFMSAFQPLELQGIDPRQQWSVFPYVSSTVDQVTDETRYKAGLDLFWRPSTNFQLTATANPDFGSVESDDVVVNLTANETFFPEKRLFFQEGQEIFDTTPRADAEGDRR
ncbi:MAG: carbohydrate binding family 9 domain-containing protein, partial [Woeseiaceae bacterium]|nr:carbohydrate binding family 9 domain-containing protein [Woeseiaceae bacterium]